MASDEVNELSEELQEAVAISPEEKCNDYWGFSLHEVYKMAIKFYKGMFITYSIILLYYILFIVYYIFAMESLVL